MNFEVVNGVRYRLVLDEAVVIRQEASEVLGLNRVGARILELIAQGRSEEEMIATLAAEFDVRPGDLRVDVAQFIQELVEAAGIVQPQGADDVPGDQAG